MAKNNQKCVRMSDEVLDFVVNFEGDGFNQKFENMVLYYKKTAHQKTRQIAQLDTGIKGAKQQIDDLNAQILAKRSLLCILRNTETHLTDVFEKLEKEDENG